MKKVILFGANCGKCKKAERIIHKVVNDHNLDIEFSKTEDFETMAQHQVIYLPSVLIAGKLVLKGVVPTEKELIQYLK